MRILLFLPAAVASLFVPEFLAAQETRATLLGLVTDPSGAAVPGASVIVRSSETRVETKATTNHAGAYEVPYLVQGSYEVTVEATGFRRYARSGVTLGLGSRVGLDVKLELGDTASSVAVTAEVPLLNTVNATAAQVLDNRAVMELPTMSNSVILQAGLAVGMQKLTYNNVNLSFTNASSNHRASGSVGGNEWSIDGTPNSGQMRRAAYLPFTDAIQEMRVESMSFDATVGNNSGAYILMTTKSGTNQYHGTLSNTHWQQRWHATASTDNGVYWGRIRDAELAGNTELARKLRAEPRQPSGRSNTYSGSIGGPVRIPKLFDGRNKLFFFFIYTGQTERFYDLETARKIYTVPTAAERAGDFSRLLRLNSTRYQLFDPLTTRLDAASGLFVRQPIAGNIISQNRIANRKMYDFYSGVYPQPNNPSISDLDGNNNLFSDPKVPFDYWATQNRFDWVPAQKDRFFFRWSWNKFSNERQDWSYNTYPGLHSEALRRNNIGGTTDWVHTFGPSTVLNITASYNRYWDNRPLNETQWQYKASDVGLPAYLDTKAGAAHTLPSLAFSNYKQLSNPHVALLPTSTASLKAQVSRYLGKHSLSAGWEGRMYYSVGGDSGLSYPGYTSGFFRFSNDLTRATSAAAGVGTLGHEWAAFLLGVPSVASVDTNDTYYATTPRHNLFLQDSYRVSSRLMLSPGIRLEWEGSIRERFNRGVREFDPSLKLAIGSAAQAAYAASPLPERPAASFVIAGGSNYLGVTGDAVTKPTWRAMPRIGFAFTVDSKTVLRGGYGMFYDTLNASHTFINQFGYNQATSTNISNESGASWNFGYFGQPGVNPLTDPFPVRSDGTRFDAPIQNRLGADTFSGRSLSYLYPGFQPALTHKFRVELERQLLRNVVLGISYNWGYTPNLGVTRDLNALPEQYWANGLARNTALENELNRNVNNPFLLSNFTALQQTSPALYQQMSTLAFFTSRVTRKNQLLRPYPQFTGLSVSQEPIGKNKYNSMIVRLEHRFARGLSLSTHYEWSHTMSKDWFANAFDAQPLWRESDFSRPMRWVVTGIYELPFGKGKPLLNQSRWISAAVGGWQIGAVSQRQSGECIDFNNVFWYGTNYRDIALSASQSTQDRWFDTSQFERNAARVPTGFNRRAFPNRLNWLRTEVFQQVDANLQKNIRVSERVKTSFRVDLINALNKQVLGNPGVNPLDTNFGRVAEFVNTPRLIQLTFRLTY
ncbi:MAG: carboxypeptidase-like regulatory domain-containing protein [Bryobacteraceae bacterium]